MCIDARLVAEKIGSGDRGLAYRLLDAIGSSDYSAVYSIINDVVMGSGDISVFWQEIIDSYRDMMVVKNASDAKAYLDLTDVEYDNLKEITAKFSMTRLSYHTTLLESALSDMQRAINSKRSIAEIALTRMCDPKLVASAEALALRVEELEKQVSMMKIGVGVSTAPPVTEKEPESLSVSESASEVKEQTVEKNSKPQIVPYEKWQAVIERIGELKRSLSSQFGKSSAYKVGDKGFLVKMNDFFAARIKANASDFAILKGVIAEAEGKTPDSIVLKVDGLSTAPESSLSDELEQLILN